MGFIFIEKVDGIKHLSVEMFLEWMNDMNALQCITVHFMTMYIELLYQH